MSDLIRRAAVRASRKHTLAHHRRRTVAVGLSLSLTLGLAGALHASMSDAAAPKATSGIGSAAHVVTTKQTSTKSTGTKSNGTKSTGTKSTGTKSTGTKSTGTKSPSASTSRPASVSSSPSAKAGATSTASAKPASSTLTAAQQLAAAPMRNGIAYGNRLTWTTDANRNAYLDDAVDVGASWIRVDLSWKDVQWEGADHYNWKPFDTVLAAAKARNLKVLPTIAFTPPWARASGCDVERCPPKDPNAFAKFAGLAAKRYAPQGIHYWEVWNEPNLSSWYPSPDPVAYSALLKPTSAALKSADPSARVILGGMASTTTMDRRMSQTDFLTKVCQAGGCAAVDAIGYHPYTFPFLASYQPVGWGTAWTKIESLPSGNLKAVLRSFGYDMPIWITEYGAPTGGPGLASNGVVTSKSPPTTHVTEELQATMAADAPAAAAKSGLIQGFFWYADRDKSADSSSAENFFGLVRADGTRKPAFTALKSAYAKAGAQRKAG